MSWQPLPTAVYCQSKRAVARRAVTCHSYTHHPGCGYTRHGYTYCGLTCQSKKAGVLPDIMNILGGLTSPGEG